MLKRTLSSVIILLLVIIVFIFGNKFVVDIFVSLIALRCIYELFNAFEQKGYHPVKWLGYLAAFFICFIHIIPKEHALIYIAAIIPITMMVCFTLVITKKAKTDIIDIAITFFGVCYIVLFLLFIAVIREMNNGRWLIWYIFIASWITDVFAYLTGKTIGKHHFTDISPKKTIEGSIGGIIGVIICTIIYTIILNNFSGMHINYAVIIIAEIILSVISQLGDLSASVIKRYAGIKDYGNIIPGHGGMLDRIDSLLFVAPFVYFVFLLII